MEYYFDQFSRFAHFFVGHTMQSLIPSLILTIVVAAGLHIIKNIDAATRYRILAAVMAIVIIMPVVTAVAPLDVDLPGFVRGIVVTEKPYKSPAASQMSKMNTPGTVPMLDTQDNSLNANHDVINAPAVGNSPEMAVPLTGIAEHAESITPADSPQNEYSIRQLILEGFPLIALLLWTLVFLVMMFRIVLGYRGLKCLKATVQPLSAEHVRRVAQLTAPLDPHRRITIGQSDRVSIPVSAGFIRPMVIMPFGLMDKLNDRELQAIIVHEMAHLARYDDWTKLAQKILTAVFFFNPAVLWINRRLDLERELACDTVVLDLIDQPRIYADCLTMMIQRNIVPSEPTLVTGAMLSRKQIFRRIEMIMNRKLNLRPLSRGRYAGLMASIIIMSILLFQAAPGLAWPYHPFKLSVFAEVIKEKSDSSTATVFRSEKDDKSQKTTLRDAPLIYSPGDGLWRLLDTAKLLQDLETALEEAEVEALEERLEQPDIYEPAVHTPPAEPLSPEPVIVPDSERGIRKIGDYMVLTPDEANDEFIDSEEGEEYLRALAESNAKFAEKYGEAIEKYYAQRKDEESGELDKADRELARELARAQSEYTVVNDLGDLFGGFSDDHIMINHDDDGSITYEWKQGADRVRVEAEGEFKLNDEDNEIVWMAEEALVEIYERKDGIRQEILIEPGDDGNPVYTYRYNGKTRDFDSDAREWYHQVMLECVRKTGFNAAERAERVYQKEGLDGVLREISDIESDYVARIYFGSVLDNFDLTDDELGRVIKFVTENVESDYEKAELLLTVAAAQKDENVLLEDFVLAVKSLGSDYERRRVLSELSLDSDVSTGVLLGILEIAESMESDYERAQLLMQLSDLRRDDDEFRYALIKAIAAIESDYERSQIIQKLLEDGRADGKIAADVLELIADMSSDYEKSKILIYLAGHSPRDLKLFDAYITVIESMSSDYEVKKSLMALGPFYDLDDSTLLKVIDITDHISSDYERSEILKEMVGEVNRGAHIRRALLQSVDAISSDYESSEILSEIIEKINLTDDDAARDIIIQAEQISSDYEKAKVLSALIPSIRGRGALEDDLADMIETISSDYERNKLYAELYRNTRGKR